MANEHEVSVICELLRPLADDARRDVLARVAYDLGGRGASAPAPAADSGMTALDAQVLAWWFDWSGRYQSTRFYPDARDAGEGLPIESYAVQTAEEFRAARDHTEACARACGRTGWRMRQSLTPYERENGRVWTWRIQWLEPRT